MFSVEGDRGAGRPGEEGVGGVREVGSGIPKVVESRRKRKKITQHCAILICTIEKM